MKRFKAGFSLVELMVGSAIALILVTAAFSFAQTQTKDLGYTTEHVYMTEVGRATLSMLTHDLRHAGVGVGYASDGTFAGLQTGSFTVGGAAFNANNGTTLVLQSGTAVPTDDIGVLGARGGYATIADFNSAGVGQICKGITIDDGSLAVLRSESGLVSTSVVVSAVHDATACSLGSCVNGCQSFNWAPSSLWSSDQVAPSAQYLGGELEGGLAMAVWFVDASDPSQPGIGALHRALFDGKLTCTARGPACGDVIANDVETLQMEVWRFDSNTGVWVNMTGQPLVTNDRLRVDVEMVVRAHASEAKATDPAKLRLEPTVCIPSGCTTDNIDRAVFRASADLLNSSRMSIH
jgi:prepilin-type N-terminal cleavage/methylation domain-containing protein